MFKNIYENKFKKVKKGRIKGSVSNWNKSNLKFGNYGIKAAENGFLTFSQLDSIRKTIVSKISRQGQIWFYAIPNIPRTSKPLGDRMGAGKGEVEKYILKVKKGLVLFEFTTQTKEQALILLPLLKSKIPFKIFGVFRTG